MGSSLSTAVGVGIVLPDPNEDEDFSEGLTALWEKYAEESGEDDPGEFYYGLLKKYPLLDINYGGVLEYFCDYTVMVKSTVTNIWDASGSIDPAKFSISNDEFDQLASFIMSLGFEEIKPEIVVSASYG